MVTPFALALRARGFDGSSATLDAALDQLDAQRVDTDGDGTSDVDELRAGTDPNSPAPGATTADPSYGCAVAPSPACGETRELALVVVAIALLLVARRRGARGREAPTDVRVSSAERSDCWSDRISRSRRCNPSR